MTKIKEASFQSTKSQYNFLPDLLLNNNAIVPIDIDNFFFEMKNKSQMGIVEIIYISLAYVV